MVIFGFITAYILPVFGFLFVVTLLKAIEKIVNKRSYGVEMFWCALFFALAIWSIGIVAAFN